jgi:hypothetical protein
LKQPHPVQLVLVLVLVLGFSGLASKKRNWCRGIVGVGDPKQLPGGEGMAAARAVKVLLATCPRALLRSTLTARASAKMRR